MDRKCMSCTMVGQTHLFLTTLTSNSELVLLSISKKTGKPLFGIFWCKWKGGNGLAPVPCSHYLWLSHLSQWLQLIPSLILLPIFRKILSTEVKRRDCSKLNAALKNCMLQNWNGSLWTRSLFPSRRARAQICFTNKS